MVVRFKNKIRKLIYQSIDVNQTVLQLIRSYLKMKHKILLESDVTKMVK